MFEIDEKELKEKLLQKLDRLLDNIADKIFTKSQLNIVKWSREPGAFHTGELMRSGNVIREFLRKKIVYSAPYAAYVEYGTAMRGEESFKSFIGESKPSFSDKIRPRTKKALHWIAKEIRIERIRGKGMLKKPAITEKEIFAKWTLGMEARPYLRPAICEVMQELQNI